MVEFELLKIIFNYLNFSTSLLGVPGNILMFILFSLKDLQKQSSSVYIRSMAISSLLMNIYWLYELSISWHGFKLADQSIFCCKLLRMSMFVTMSSASWFQVVASLDTFLTIAYPTRFRIIKTQLFRLVIVLILIIYSIGSNIFVYLNINLRSFRVEIKNLTILGCAVDRPNEINMSSLINSAVVPFLIMLICSAATIIHVMRSRERAGVGRRAVSGMLRARDVKFGVTLIVLNFTFLLTNAPYAFLFVVTMNYSYRFLYDSIWFNFFENISIFLFISHYAIAFYVQLAVNKIFKKSFSNMAKKAIRKIC